MQTITKGQFDALLNLPQVIERKQQLTLRHITELIVDGQLIAVRTLTASTAAYRAIETIGEHHVK